MRTLALVALLAGALACDRAPREHVVIIHAMAFDPPTLTVSPGDRVTWRNEDLVAHTATAAGAFDSGELPPSRTFTVTLGTRGEVKYACRLHPTMLGTVDVK